jgi:Sec-independent protein translocase protein TatA
MAILGVLALLVFGEKKLPGVMRQAGKMMREVQNTSQSFLREMDRAADVSEPVPPIGTPAAAELPFEPALPVEPEGVEPKKGAGP